MRWALLQALRTERGSERTARRMGGVALACSTVSSGVSRLRLAAARYVSAFALWHRRPWLRGLLVDRLSARCRSTLVAGPAARPDRLRKLALPGAIVVCRQRAAHQSRLACFRRFAPGDRFPIRLSRRRGRL